MTKINYPEREIGSSQDKELQNINKTLASLSGFTFEIPGGVDDEVLSNFPSYVEGFSKNFELLEENIKKTDSNYKKLNNKISGDFKSFESTAITKREPIV